MEKSLSEHVLAPSLEEDRDDPIRDAKEDVDLQHIFEAYVIWKSLPTILRFPPKERNGAQPSSRDFAATMGLDDDFLLEMIELRYKRDFAEKYNVSERTLSRWNKKISLRDPLADIRVWALPLHKNILMSLYNKALRGGLPEHYALWLKVTAGWSEKIRLENRTIRTVNLRIVEGPKHIEVETVPEEPETPA